MPTYLYVDGSLRQAGLLQADLSSLTERHKLKLGSVSLRPTGDLLSELAEPGVEGVVLEMLRGWLGWSHLRFARRVLASGRRFFVHWPREEAVECIDEERLRSLRRHWWAVRAWQGVSWRSLEPVAHWGDLETLVRKTSPVPFAPSFLPGRERPLPGCGVYLRTDFWVNVVSGGSYGHTCYLARALASTTERFVCFLPHRYALLDDLGVEQVVLDLPVARHVEKTLVDAAPRYERALRDRVARLRPAYLYERLCLGNYVGALLSRDLGLPYIVEYNGSEIAMSRSFGTSRHYYEDFHRQAEEAAFRQATLISVVSEPIAEDLVSRGVDPGKILVNPNGADLDTYAPPSPEERRALRRRLGWDDSHRVIGFTGTFGGWHGIDVLAEALPRIAEAVPETRFLLIGDGNYKHLVDRQVEGHNLRDRVRAVGQVPQSEGARLLQACDVYVSPHSRQMAGGRFFGSPTKVFEYMAMGGGIVASDLEQIGEVLSPALRAADLRDETLRVTDQRAVLCAPGGVEEFAASVVGLARRPDLCAALGRNARQAVADHYSWDRHVERLWRALRGEKSTSSPARRQEPALRLATGDAYKDEVQRQWDNNPVGSQYVKAAKAHTLEWFLEVEAHRYGEYAPWMPEMMEFGRHAGEEVLEIGGGIGTDLAQFARHGARVTDVDLAAGHLDLAQENFRLRGLTGRFIHHDAESLPFESNRFDLVYSNGVIHHTPNTADLVGEILRVLKPGGKAIVMVYAEDSLHYWLWLVGGIGVWQGVLADYSMGEIMSRSVELSANDARPLVKVYTRARLRRLFSAFSMVQVHKRQLTSPELPFLLRFLPVGPLGRLMGWNLVVKAVKPAPS